MRALTPKSLFSSSPSSPPPARFRLSSILVFYSTAASDLYKKRGGISSPYSYSSSSSSSSSSSWRHHDDDGRGVKVSVWWDFENCTIPSGVHIYKVSRHITSALRANGIKGPVTITAFGDVTQLSRFNQEALTSTGICLTHVPNSGRNSADRSLLVDLVYWVCQNPPPAHLFLISGDRDFANILHRLRMNNYNILLARATPASDALASAATITWQWHELLRGENLSGKHFNHPPDGVQGYWHGDYKGSLDDPCLDMDHPVGWQAVDSSESTMETGPRPIPKVFVNKIRQILNLYPHGIGVSELRSELGKSMDKDYFGYKKFSHLLLSMPNVLKLQWHPSGEGQPLAYGVNSNAAEINAFKSKSPMMDVTNAHAKSNSSEGQVSSSTTHQSCIQPVDSASSANKQKGHTKVTESNGISSPSHSQSTAEVPSICHEEVGMGNSSADSAPTPQHSSTDEGFFQKIWRNWFGYRSDDSNKKRQAIPVEDSNPSLASDEKKGGSEEEFSQLSANHTNPSGEEVSQLSDNLTNPGLHSSSSKEKQSVPYLSITCSMDNDKKSWQDFSFFKQFVKWLKIWKKEEECPDHVSVSANQAQLNRVTEESGSREEGVNQGELQMGTPVLFSKDYFWKDMESFLLSPKGSALICKSRNREHMAQELQKNGPLLLNCLKASNFKQLVDWLISEKKWVEEFGGLQEYPFRLTLPAERCNSSDVRGSNGLSSIFSGSMSQPSLRKRTENLDGNQPKDLAQLKAWFLKYQYGKGSNEPEDLRSLFKREFKKEIDFHFYGFSSMESLLASCLAKDDSSNSNKNPPRKSRLEILGDCRKLLSEILKDHPEGLNMGCFKPLFIEKYGYALDYQVLGYPKLASLLQVMPGVKLESGFIIPSAKVPKDASQKRMAGDEALNFVQESCITKVNSPEYEVADSEASDEDPIIMATEQDSEWEELGPILNTGGQVDSIADDSEKVSPQSIISGTNSKSNLEKDESDFTEFSLSEEDSSDSEESPNLKAGGDRRRSDEDSSLLQILDSWYSSKDSSGKGQLKNADGLVDCSRKSNNSKSSESSVSVGSEWSLGSINVRRKLKTCKTFSFVSDPVGNGKGSPDEKGLLVDSILDTLKKSGDSRLQS